MRDLLHAAAILGTVFLSVTSVAFAQKSDAAQDIHRDPNQLVREVVANELRAQQDDLSLWRYRQQKQDGARVVTSQVVETEHGDLLRAESFGGRALTEQESKKEDQHIQHLLSDREALNKQAEDQKKDAQRERDLMKMLPDAFRYEFAGRDGKLLKLNFKPDPLFRPSQREGEVFHHMQGMIWIDTEQNRIAKISGRLSSEVKFGGGILGRLDRDGTFFVEQQDVGKGHWELTELNVNMTGKAFLFKSIGMKERERNTDFRAVPPEISLQEAARILKESSAESAKTANAASIRN